MRADVYIFSQGAAKSRKQAKDLIEAGAVSIDGRQVKKASEEIDETASHEIKIEKTEKYVSRGGLKLEAALDTFKIDVTGMSAIDVGASTGGFTDCLLSRGAVSCVCVDSGHGQLDPAIESDPRVTSYEKYNARELSRDVIPEGADIAVMDVSFISQTLIIPRIPDVLRERGILVSLIKPQFEAGRQAIGKGGIVKSAADREAAVLRVVDAAAACGLYCRGLCTSPIKGGDGNTEYLALFCKVGEPLDRNTVRQIAKKGS